MSIADALCLTRLVGWLRCELAVAGAGMELSGDCVSEKSLVDVLDKLPERVWNAESWEEISSWRV